MWNNDFNKFGFTSVAHEATVVRENKKNVVKNKKGKIIYKNNFVA